MHTGGHHTTHIVKRSSRQHPEPFNPAKLQKSIAAALLSSGAHVGHAEQVAKKVVEEVTEWLESRPEVTSADIRKVAAKHLQRHHPDASYLYEQHRSTL